MDPKKMADLLSRNLTLSTEYLVPPGGKFKNANLFYFFAAFGSIILKDLYLHMIENKNLHILSLSSFLSVATHQISKLIV